MKRVMDKTDERILAELTHNARIAHAELASLVNLSRNAVRQRVERMERDGVIQGYTMIRGRAAPEADLLTAMLFIYRKDRLRGADVIQVVARIPEVVSCVILSGDFDLLLRVEASEADRIRSIWQQISALPGVQDTLTALVLATPFHR